MSETVHHYKTQGVCSREIRFEVTDGQVHHVVFEGGCRGNTRGVAALAEGMPVAEVIKRLQGIPCQGQHSCPDELAQALLQYQQGLL
ncbi:MAG: TIGR03905 family TSCPD domain-containing protein [Oscillospiraceae bacterium]|mgnify:CR=1 FL=1|nr:TIGR03905 family TSCPD domain-containing protein [Oscillospiraceae bacterium]MDD4368766.1 TIGR03905 family TSCPD domain-containing protein [Oscillospiraceae bacterium]